MRQRVLFSHYFARLAVLLPLLIVCSLEVGCGETPAKTTAKTPTKKPKPKPPEPKPVDPNAFASVDEALAAVVAGFEDQTKAKDINTAQQWMQSKGASIEPQIKAKLLDPSSHLAVRIMCCRVLGNMGAIAVPTLKEVSAPGYEPVQLRQNAVNSLGLVKPVNKEIIDYVVQLGWDQELKVRVAAMQAMQKIGPPVKDAHPDVVQKLMGVLNSDADDQLRNQAKLTLKAVEPRQGFSGMGKVEK